MSGKVSDHNCSCATTKSLQFIATYIQIGYTYCWTPGDQVWTRKAPMLYRRQCHAMFTHQGNIYVIGGYTAGDLEDLSLGKLIAQ